MFIDTHCHLYLAEFKTDITAVVQRALDSGVQRFYLPAIDSSEMQNMLTLENSFSKFFRMMIGLHPCSVKPDTIDYELSFVADWLKKKKFVAVGEIGLDFYWDTSTAALQLYAFETQMQLALEHKLPIVIHSRNAMSETIVAVEPFARKGLRGIFHCFGGSVDEARSIIEMGFYLGIGGVITYKKSGLDAVVAAIGADQLVLETDAPYLTPTPYRGKRNESAYLPLVAQKIADVTGLSVKEVANTTTRNALNIFGS